ncbi:hypothetical protein TNCT_274301 [Trichonephila clavata]|uniref:Uncharacterized protein n=1 Tax=Trichonephila clavata TaxID=2740835 RepID=A0A8X6H0D9_TRICU|nr:hypothetical protein TNCT_274301 [Trichonephila clavata]
MAYLYQGQRKYMMPTAKDFIPSCILKRPPSTKFENCRNIALTPSCASRILEPTACFSINSLSELPNKQPQNISVSTVKFHLMNSIILTFKIIHHQLSSRIVSYASEIVSHNDAWMGDVNGGFHIVDNVS